MPYAGLATIADICAWCCSPQVEGDFNNLQYGVLNNRVKGYHNQLQQDAVNDVVTGDSNSIWLEAQSDTVDGSYNILQQQANGNSIEGSSNTLENAANRNRVVGNSNYLGHSASDSIVAGDLNALHDASQYNRVYGAEACSIMPSMRLNWLTLLPRRRWQLGRVWRVQRHDPRVRRCAFQCCRRSSRHVRS